MEPAGERTGDVEKGEDPAEDKAADQASAPSASASPRTGHRERGSASRPRPGVPTPSAGVNGTEATPEQQQRGSGRVLRDRATRAVPAWLKDARSDDEDEPSPDTAPGKRRKVSNSRRKRHAEAGGGLAGVSLHGTDLEDLKKPATDAPAPPPRRPVAQTRAKPPAAKANRGPARPVCKTEPELESPAVEDASKTERTEIEVEERVEVIRPVMADQTPPAPMDPIDRPQSQSVAGAIEEVSLSSDDVPFRDDLNDQSYDPEDGSGDVIKPKRNPPRLKEKKEKEKTPKTEKELAEIKVEGLDSLDSLEEEVKLEEENVDDPDGPRRRGRRKKDDKTPRLPKRRKKPPVQYVRCEIEGCGTVLAHPRYLQHHIKYQHLLKKKYVCPHPSCGRLFRLQKQLLRHAKHHTDQRDYICEFCARAFKSSHNLAVHRMIHTGEKPLQCEICGFTCRQKASLNWHMKKHDADATYQFSCSICAKKFEKKDCVVAHKAKSHPEVLIAEALAANAGSLITTPSPLLDLPGNPLQAEDVGQMDQDGQLGHQVTQVSHQVVLLGQEPSLHAVQVPVTIALSPLDPPSPADSQPHLQLQMPVQFVQAAARQPQLQQLALHQAQLQAQLQSYSSQQQNQGQILQMTFQPLGQSQSHVQQIPILTASHQLLSSAPVRVQDHAAANGCTFVLDNPGLTSSLSVNSLQRTEVAGDDDDDVVWEEAGQEVVQQVLI